MYKDNWSEIAGNCDSTIYLGGGADSVTTKWISELLGKETRVVMNVSLGKSGNTSFNRQGVELFTPAQLRTMPEDDCIVIEKSLDAFKGKKYKALEHPQRKLVESLDPYYFEEDKLHYLQGYAEVEAEEEAGPEEAHGQPEEIQEEQEIIKEEREEEKEQIANEIAQNEDEEGNKIIEEPKPIDAPNSNFESKISIADNSEEPKLSERMDSLMDFTDDLWGEEELFFGSQPGENG